MNAICHINTVLILYPILCGVIIIIIIIVIIIIIRLSYDWL